jgi:Ca-activated chloride channel family protein
MSLTWPWALLALLAVPLVLAVAWWSRRRRRRMAVRVPSAALVRAALPGRSLWRRRIPAALLLVGVTVLGVGAARPQRSEAISSSATTILLAIDVSGSMCSTDVSPNRITAAEKAAESFIKAQPGGARMGLVAFAGTAAVLVPPTQDKSKLLSAVSTLTTDRGTAIGEAILTSLDAIAEIDPSVAPTGATVEGTGGGYAADAIVVLTDGANTQGVDPQTAAQQAAQRRVRVYTIGFGTTNPASVVCDSSQIAPGAGGFGGSFGFGGGFGGRDGGGRVFQIDEQALEQVASTTGAHYYRAQNAGQLNTALANLPRSITVTHKNVDLADRFAAVGALLVVAAMGLSLWWNRVRTVPGGRPASGAATTAPG